MKTYDLLTAMAGAALGGGLRYAVGWWTAERWGAAFPWHTFAINVLGAFLLGVVMAVSVERDALSASWRLFLGVGVLGGFTTFSTLSYETAVLLEQGLVLKGALNMFGSGVLGILAAIIGLAVGRII